MYQTLNMAGRISARTLLRRPYQFTHTTYQGIRPAEKMLVKLQMKAITLRYFSSRRLMA